MKTLRQVLNSIMQGLGVTRVRATRHLFDSDELEVAHESQYHITVREVQNGSVISIRYDTKNGDGRGYSRLCAEGEDPIDHIRQLIAIAKLEL